MWVTAAAVGTGAAVHVATTSNQHAAVLPHRITVLPTSNASGPPPRPAAAAVPVRVRIPVISVNAPVGRLALDKSGALQPPASDTVTGWWPGSPRPGEAGPAVIVGHLDSHTGPAVFAGLSMLRAGDTVSVDRADGTTVDFRISRVQVFTKAQFPTTLVYGPTRNAQLRLITCGGAFDAWQDTYLGNLVVFADLTGIHPTTAW